MPGHVKYETDPSTGSGVWPVTGNLSAKRYLSFLGECLI